MKGSTRWLLTFSLLLSVTPVSPAPASTGCEDIYPAMALGPFPAGAPSTTPLFYAADDAAGGSFRVRWTGFVCNDATVSVNAEYGDVRGSATEPDDYAIPEGQRTPSVCEAGCPQEATVTFPLVNDVVAEAATETFTLALSNPRGGALDPPTSAPFVLVDADGATRVAFDELAYASSETHDALEVAVWRAGPVGLPSEVPYEVRPGGTSPATEADYTVTSPNPLAFGAGERVKLITLSIVNDRSPEPTESLELSLGTPTGAALDAGTKTVSIADNEESLLPTSRFHHPRQGRRYAPDDFRMREIHVFTEDLGGSGVVRAQMALRSNLQGNRCAWLVGKRFRPGSCREPRWFALHRYETDFFYHRFRPLRPSVGTSIQSYTAFSRAVDGAGNVERALVKGRNRNTFEVTRAEGRERGFAKSGN